MEFYTKEDAESAKKVLSLYVDLVENNGPAVKFYLAENVVLDWFGKTVKGSKKVTLFLEDQVRKVTHHISNAVPAENVSFRETHRVKIQKDDSPLLIAPASPLDKDTVTPPKQVQPSTSMTEMGQGDGVHNCNQLISPPKKIKLTPETDGLETLEGESDPSHLRYLTGEGSVEFHRPSIKKLQTESRWRRPTRLHLGYTSSSFKDCTIYLIIYEGNLKCRRNLFKEFCESEEGSV